MAQILACQRYRRGEYLNLPNKTQTGRPTQYYFDRQITPKIFLWPTPENSTDTLEYFYVRRIQDADTLQNTSDVPFRFLPCMVAGLSYYLSIKRAPERTQLLKSLCMKKSFKEQQPRMRDRWL